MQISGIQYQFNKTLAAFNDNPKLPSFNRTIMYKLLKSLNFKSPITVVTGKEMVLCCL